MLLFYFILFYCILFYYILFCFIWFFFIFLTLLSRNKFCENREWEGETQRQTDRQKHTHLHLASSNTHSRHVMPGWLKKKKKWGVGVQRSCELRVPGRWRLSWSWVPSVATLPSECRRSEPLMTKDAPSLRHHWDTEDPPLTDTLAAQTAQTDTTQPITPLIFCCPTVQSCKFNIKANGQLTLVDSCVESQQDSFHYLAL